MTLDWRVTPYDEGDEFTPLGLQHSPQIRAALGTYRRQLSEYSLANLFLFRREHDYQFRAGAQPLIQGRTYDGRAHLMPLFDWTKDAAGLLDLARQSRALIYPVLESDVDATLAASVQISYRPEDADYIYRSQDLAGYMGPAYKPKRQLADGFERSCRPQVQRIEADHRSALRAVLDGWLSDVGRPLKATDYTQCAEALDLLAALPLFGLMAVDHQGAPRGFVLAAEVAPGMAAIHFAKARRQPDGALPFLFRAFAREFGEAYALLNFEQDLGNPGFRQNKRSYSPIRLTQKLRLEPLP
jgi:uncharacterized protein